MTRMMIAALAGLGLAGCAAVETPLDDGYQVGDLTGTAVELQARYCTNADPYQRAVVLALMHQGGVPIPLRGACTDLLELIDPGELPEINAEAALEDQERFQEWSDASRDPRPTDHAPGTE